MKGSNTLFAFCPSPGIGDFLVRIPAIRLLARYFSVTVLFSLPESMRGFVEESIGLPGVRIVLSSHRYRKSRPGIIMGHIDDIAYSARHRLPADVAILISDSNSMLGYVKYGMMSRLIGKAQLHFALETDGRKFPFHRNVAVDSRLQKMQRYFEMAREVLKELGVKDCTELGAYLPPRRTASPVCKNVLLAPGGKLKSQWWPGFADLTLELEKRGIATTLVGSADESELINGMRRSGQIAMLGRDLREITAAMEQATVVVCNDSGMLHVAVWCGVPVIALCGPRFAATWTGYPTDVATQFYYDADPVGPETPDYRLACLAGIPLASLMKELEKHLE